VRVAGEPTARQLLLQAAVLGAREMKARGFVQELAEEGDFDAALQDLVRQVAALAPQAARLNKRTLRALREQADPSRRRRHCRCWRRLPLCSRRRTPRGHRGVPGETPAGLLKTPPGRGARRDETRTTT
jgi:enoyl-CoA hydratase/carnithine racemase